MVSHEDVEPLKFPVCTPKKTLDVGRLGKIARLRPGVHAERLERAHGLFRVGRTATVPDPDTCPGACQKQGGRPTNPPRSARHHGIHAPKIDETVHADIHFPPNVRW